MRLSEIERRYRQRLRELWGADGSATVPARRTGRRVTDVDVSQVADVVVEVADSMACEVAAEVAAEVVGSMQGGEWPLALPEPPEPEVPRTRRLGRRVPAAVRPPLMLQARVRGEAPAPTPAAAPEVLPPRSNLEDLVDQAEQALSDATHRARRIVQRAERESEALLDGAREASQELRYQAETRLRLIEQRTEEAARIRGRDRGVAEATEQLGAVMHQAEEALAELLEERARVRAEAQRDSVDLAVQMTRRLLELAPEELPDAVKSGLEGWLEGEMARRDGEPLLRVHPSRRDLFAQMAPVQEGRLRLEVDPAARPSQARLLGACGASEHDPVRGLEGMRQALQVALAEATQE